MRKFQLTLFFVVFVPFMTASAIDRIPEGGWSRVWGVAEIALAAAISVGAFTEVRKEWKKRRSSE
ncbi:hypothetical protein SZN_18591 [Streptomyces zinciresistens K42]|uniref:Uncharacterized protein n=1 Tax=Streptomyces zinciresistens K42 TaxID=700597 RepID=G2GDZ0_9ACTN|nr:hypothetical protein [Streptomyces zinciresistens]EGX58296.1 hypothetical protein SZN_18591 [Streptomyces zinciresistens K42]